MEGWKHDKFKNQIQYKSGYTWSKEQELRIQEPNAVRVLTVTNVQKELDLKEELYLKDVSEKDKVDKAVSKDWCIAVSSNGNRKRIGNAVFIKDDTDYLFASFLTAFRPKPNSEIIPEFFFRWLSSHFIQERLTSVSEGTTGLGNLDIRFLRNLDIYFPDKHMQTAIANILSTVDEAIASVHNSIAAAERLKKSLMQNLLTGKMKPDGTFRTPDEFYIDEKFGKVPVGWEVKKVQELSIQVTDGEHQTPERTETGYYLLSARNIKNGYLSLDDVDYIPEKELRRIQKRCNPQAGDILISCSGTIGNVCIVPDGFIGGMVRSAALVKLNSDKIESQFAELLFQSHYLQNQMKVAVASSVQGNIFQGAIKKLRMFYPHDKQERLAITERLYLFNKEIASMQDKIIVLERLKKSLMQNLLTGKTKMNVLI